MSQRRVLFEMKNSCEEKYKSIIVLPTLTLELFWGNMCYSWARKISLKNFFFLQKSSYIFIVRRWGIGDDDKRKDDDGDNVDDDDDDGDDDDDYCDGD